MTNSIAAYFGQIFSPSSDNLERKVEAPAKVNTEPISALVKTNHVLERILKDGYKFKQVWVAPVQLYVRGKSDFVLYCPVHKSEVIRYEDKS